MSFVPGHYELALNAVGYERLLRGADGSKILLIAKKDSCTGQVKLATV